MAQIPRWDICKNLGRDQHYTRSCILEPEILNTVCVQCRLPRTIMSGGRSPHPDFSLTSACGFFLLFFSSLLSLSICFSLPFHPLPLQRFSCTISTTSFRFSFHSRLVTTNGTHWLTTFGQIGITFNLSCCAFNFHCFDAFPELSFISSSR